MNGRTPLQGRAADLMRVALSMLDEAGDETTAGAHLQMALDSLTAAPSSAPGGEAFPGAGISDPTLVRSMGGALAVLAGLLEGKGIASVEEISNMLGIYAVVTGETSPDEGLILACWAGTLRDLAQGKADGEGERNTWR